MVSKSAKISLSVPAIRRFPLYLSFLKYIKDKEFISAREIAQDLHIDHTQIIKDFSHIDIVGKTKVGYNINKLIKAIELFLGYHVSRKAFVVGVGHLGASLIEYNEFGEEGLEILAGFDIDTDKINKEINKVKIYKAEKFDEVYAKTPVDIGILTVPADQAQEVANSMIVCGIKAIWNFTCRPISAPDTIIIENTSIDSGLAMIKWKLRKNKPLIYKNRIL